MLAENLNFPNKSLVSLVFTAIISIICSILIISSIASSNITSPLILLPLGVGLVMTFIMSSANAFEGNLNYNGHSHLVSSVILCGGVIVMAFVGAVVAQILGNIVYSGNSIEDIKEVIPIFFFIGSVFGSSIGFAIVGAILGFYQIGGEKTTTPFQIYSAIFISVFLITSFLTCRFI